MIIALLAIVLALAFTLVPVLPGTVFILLGAIVIGFTDGFGEFTPIFWIGQVVFAAIYLAVDNIAQIVGVKRQGGSRGALIGGTIGVIAGSFLLAPVIGPFALVFGPPVGAVAGTIVGEVMSRRRAPGTSGSGASLSALGVGALIAFVVSLFAKLVIVAIQATWLILEVR